ncbi:MAG: sugar-binding domain-containing protein [Ornithinimicrobium sp.]
MGASLGPAESVLAATVARRYYLHGEAKKDIAAGLGINRFKVARLIDSALESGLVRIEITSGTGVDLDASALLLERFDLQRCVVVEGTDIPGPHNQAALGKIAAAVIREALVDGDVLGLPWSRAVLAMTSQLTELPMVRVVQLSGAMELPGINASAVDIVREAARVSGGQSVIFHAPFILDDDASAHALRRQPSVRSGLSAVADVTHAVVGLGQWHPSLTTLYDMATKAEQQALSDADVVGEIAGVFFDESGRPIQTQINQRLITLSGRELAAIPDVTAIVEGAAKAPAVCAAIRGGLINGLVVDAALAAALIGDTNEPDSTR